MGRGFDDRSTYQIVCLTALGIVGPVLAGEFLRVVLGNPSAHPVERVGGAMIATGLTLAVPVLLAATTSGRWYSAKAFQPELIYRFTEDGGVDLEWESRPIHAFLPVSVVVLIVGGLGLANLPEFARDKEMTVEGVILLLTGVPLVAFGLTSRKRVVKRGDSLRAEARYLFVRVSISIDAISRQGVLRSDIQLQNFFMWYLEGEVKKETRIFGTVVRRKTASEQRLVLSYFRNVTPSEFESLIRSDELGREHRGRDAARHSIWDS